MISERDREQIAEAADEMGTKYASLQEKIGELGLSLDDIKSDIKDFAKEFGDEIGKETLVEGAKFIVGFQTRGKSPYVDLAALSKFLRKNNPDLWKQVTTRVISEELLNDAINSGEFSRKKLTKFVVTPKDTTTSIVVKSKDKQLNKKKRGKRESNKPK